MLKCHLISIFLAIYFHNIGDETFALKITVPDQHPEICQAKNYITCKNDIDCNAHVKIIEYLPRHEKKRKGVCKNVRNKWQKHCICRRDGCDHGDICKNNADCGRDKWGRRGKCVPDNHWRDGKVSYGNKMMKGSKYDKKYGPWKTHKHCECLPPKYPDNCQGQGECKYNSHCGQYGTCARPGQFQIGKGYKRYCMCRRKTCGAGDFCVKDSDCGYLTPLGTGKRGTCETIHKYKKVCKCPLSPEFDLKEAVDQTLQTARENQMIVKEGKKWLATLYAALKEKKPHRSYEKEDMEDGEYVIEDDTDTDGDDHRTRSDYDDDDHNEIEEYDEDEDTDRIDYDIATESTMSETIGS